PQGLVPGTSAHHRRLRLCLAIQGAICARAHHRVRLTRPPGCSPIPYLCLGKSRERSSRARPGVGLLHLGQKTLVVCGDARAIDVGLREADYDATFPLDTEGPSQNVRLEFPDESLVATLPDAALDLLEIASYVYAVDRLVSRGEADVRGDRWIRQNTLVVSVRLPDVWIDQGVRRGL